MKFVRVMGLVEIGGDGVMVGVDGGGEGWWGDGGCGGGGLGGAGGGGGDGGGGVRELEWEVEDEVGLGFFV